MISLKISGRGGNQLFQYAFVQKYIDENCKDEKINVSFEYLEEKKTDNQTFVNILREFNIKEINVIEKVNYNFKQKILDYIYRILLKVIRLNAKIRKRALQQSDYIFLKNVLQKTMNENGLYYYIPGMDEFYKSKEENIIFFGSYEDSKIMNNYKKEIFKYYKIDVELNDKAQKIYDIASRTDSICITIRRGDFLIKENKKNFYICDEQYFLNAISKMNKIIKYPQYIVFSDDIEWCKQNMIFPMNTIYENDGNTISQKLKIMSQCKNFIISNSTFSWWAQYLSENTNKKVIAPKKWNNFEYVEPIYDKNWILI